MVVGGNNGARPGTNVFVMAGRIRALLREGLSTAEITSLLGCKANTVYGIRFRLRHRQQTPVAELKFAKVEATHHLPATPPPQPTLGHTPMQSRPRSKPDPCRVRYGLWRLHVLGLTAAQPLHGGAIQRELQEWGIPLALGTLMHVLQQMVEAGLLERMPTDGFEKPLRITSKGRQAMADLRSYLVNLTHLVDGEPQADARERMRAPSERSKNAQAALIALVRETELATANLRTAMLKMKQLVDAALAGQEPGLNFDLEVVAGRSRTETASV